MVKTKKSTKVLALLIAFALILTALIFIIPNKQMQTVEAAELTPEQHAERRAKPGLYETGTTTLITSWEDLVSSGVITVSSGSFTVNSSISKGDLVCKNVDGLTSLEDAFANCSNLTNIDCYNLDTSNVFSMGGMFLNCSSISKLDLSNFRTSKVNAFAYMFCGCYLDELNISSFTFEEVENTGLSVFSMMGTFGFNYYWLKENLGDEFANSVYYGKDNADPTVDTLVSDEQKIAKMTSLFEKSEIITDGVEGGFKMSIKKIIAPTTSIPESVSIGLLGTTGYVVSGSGSTEPVYFLNGMEGKTLVPFNTSEDVPSTGVVSNMLSVVICLACLSALVITLTNKKREMAK